MHASWSDDLNLAREAARLAGTHLWAHFRDEQPVLSDAGRDIKLQADRDAEKIIIDFLRAKSDYPILSEECGEVGEIGERGPVWVVDPLDGTLNYSRRIPICCTSIGLTVDLKPVLGAIFDFTRGEFFTGAIGQGAWVEDARGQRTLQVKRREPLQSILASGFPSGLELTERVMGDYMRRMLHFKKLRLPGSATLELAWLAQGSYDAYVEEEIHLWDVAAGLAIIEAAGGWYEMQAVTGKPWAYIVRAGSSAQVWEGLEI